MKPSSRRYARHIPADLILVVLFGLSLIVSAPLSRALRVRFPNWNAQLLFWGTVHGVFVLTIAALVAWNWRVDRKHRRRRKKNTP